jgi:hypothetical protein
MYPTHTEVPGSKIFLPRDHLLTSLDLRAQYPDISTATATLQTGDTYLEFHRSVLHMPRMGLVGMESVKCVITKGKWGQWLKGFNLSAQRISCTT